MSILSDPPPLNMELVHLVIDLANEKGIKPTEAMSIITRFVKEYFKYCEAKLLEVDYATDLIMTGLEYLKIDLISEKHNIKPSKLMEIISDYHHLNVSSSYSKKQVS